MICDYIDRHKDAFGVEPICAVLTEHNIAIAPSTYRVHRSTPVSDAEWADAHTANALLDLWRSNWGVYGVDKCHAAMRRSGHDLGRDQIGRLMRIIGISGAVRGKHRTVTTRRDPAGMRHPDLIGRAWATRPDRTSGGSRTSRIRLSSALCAGRLLRGRCHGGISSRGQHIIRGCRGRREVDRPVGTGLVTGWGRSSVRGWFLWWRGRLRGSGG